MNKTTLGKAIQQALNTSDPNAVQAATPKGKQGKVRATPLKEMDPSAYAVATETAMDVYFADTDRRANIEEFAAVAEDLRWALESKRARMAELCGLIFPRGKATYNEQQTLLAYLRGISVTAYDSMRAAIKALPKMGGALASKDGGKKSATRAVSPSRWYSALAKDLAKVRDRMTKVPKHDIDSDVLRAFTSALRAVDAAEKAMAKRIKAA